MNDDESLEMGPDPNTPMARPTTYERLMRQSKKLGGVATTTLQGVQRALQRDVTLPVPTKYTRNRLMHRLPQRKHPQTSHEKELERAQQLRKTVKKAHEILASVETVFPATLFPDSIVVDRSKVSIKKRSFFMTSNTISFQIEDILNVSCGTGPVFGSLTIASRVMSTIDHFQIEKLRRRDAIFLKNLIQGHIIAKNNKLETDKLSREEMIETLCELGIDSEG